MKIFGRKKVEKRNFTEAYVEALIANAAGTSEIARLNQTAASEVVAGFYSAAFACLAVTPKNSRTECLDSETLALAARQLLLTGNAVFYISMMDGKVNLIPVASWDVTGSENPDSWMYRIDIFGPSSNTTRIVHNSGIVHLIYQKSPGRPHCGTSPLTTAIQSNSLYAESELQLLHDARSPRGSLLPVPKFDGESDAFDAFRAGLKNAQGSISVVETTADGYGTGTDGAPKKDYDFRKFGFGSPAELINLRSEAFMNVLQSCGLNPDLVMRADGTGQRESLRRWANVNLNGLVQRVQTSLRKSLEIDDLKLSIEPLMASDLSGKARAFASLVGTGAKSADEAAKLTGLIVTDD